MHIYGKVQILQHINLDYTWRAARSRHLTTWWALAYRVAVYGCRIAIECVHLLQLQFWKMNFCDVGAIEGNRRQESAQRKRWLTMRRLDRSKRKKKKKKRIEMYFLCARGLTFDCCICPFALFSRRKHWKYNGNNENQLVYSLELESTTTAHSLCTTENVLDSPNISVHRTCCVYCCMTAYIFY